MIPLDTLVQMQHYPLHIKIRKTELRIQEWYESHDGMIYIAFSGGLDSTVVAHIAKRLYPDIPLVFCNTGQELTAIINFVKSIPGVVVIRPKHSYKWVNENYGYPVVSKAVSIAISRYRTAKDDVQRNLRLYGGNKSNLG